MEKKLSKEEIAKQEQTKLNTSKCLRALPLGDSTPDSFSIDLEMERLLNLRGVKNDST